MRPRFVRILIATVLAIAITPGWAADSYQYRAHRVPDSKAGYDFTLVDPDGKPFALRSLRGKFVLIDFGFTHCPNICPTTLANLAGIYALLSPEEQARVQVLFITIDPKRDTSNVLKNYVPFFDKRFVGLTGKSDQIEATARAYGVVYEEESQPKTSDLDYTLAHSGAIYLVGTSGKCIAFYGNNDLRDSQRIAEDLRHFLALPPDESDNWESQKTGVVKPLPTSGRQLYLEQCASCHLESGRGIPGKYPSLVGSAWVTGAPNRLTALVLDGVTSDHVAGAGRSVGVMPAWRTVLPPAYTAQILTYIRQAWGNEAPAISGSYVEKLFYQFASRSSFWSWKELKALPPDRNANGSRLEPARETAP